MTLKNNGLMIIPWDSKTMFHGDVGAAPRSTGDIFTWKKDVLFYVIQMKNNETDCTLCSYIDRGLLCIPD